MFVARGRRSPLFHFVIAGIGVALIVFALIDTTASRLVLVVGGIDILVGLYRGITSLSGPRRGSSASDL